MLTVLTFIESPGNAQAGTTLATVQVEVDSSPGDRIITSADSITLSLATNPGAAALGGTVTESAQSGWATFTNLTISKPGLGYELKAVDNSESATSAATAPFNIWAFTSVQSLSPGNVGGEVPEGGLVMDSNGDLFGTTSQGGTGNGGTIYELSGPNHSVYTTLVNFTDTTGSYLGGQPQGSLVIDSSGNLYGTTARGGMNGTVYGGDGTVFELSGTNHTTFTTLHSFDSTDGLEPYAGLTLYGGNLYGTTETGGTDDEGTVFELSGSGYSTFKTLLSFTGNTGTYPGEDPIAAMTADSSGDLWGTTEFGGSSGDGEVFEIVHGDTLPTGYGEIAFTGAAGIYPGENPATSVVITSGDNVLGTTSAGDTNGDGNVYELSSANHSVFTDILKFSSTLGDYKPGEFGSLEAEPALTLNSSGDIFTTTQTGGTYGEGALLELPVTNFQSYKTLASFDNPYDLPIAQLTLDGSGNLYGTTTQVSGNTSAPNDDAVHFGTVFEIPASAYTSVETLYTFIGGSGINPNAGLTLAPNGNLYGTTLYGGAYNVGTLFELSGTNYSTCTTLLSFTGSAGSYPGAGPDGGLLVDGGGNLIGTTENGGTSNDGTVYELSGPGYDQFKTLVNFTGTTGSYPGQEPGGNLTMYGTGEIFGVTYTGGTNDVGTVYALSGATHQTFSSLYSFPESTNSNPDVYPQGNMVLDSSGNLFGVTTDGGLYADGSGTDSGDVFEIPASNRNSLIVLDNFNNSDGSGYQPIGGLVIDSQGNLYGVTASGGADGDGTVFEILKTISNQIETLVSFTGNSGDYPGSEANGPLLIDTSGDLFGTTSQGGTFNDGTVFELPYSGLVRPFVPLVSFTGSSGSDPGSGPSGALTLDGGGNLLGTTAETSSFYADGTIYEISSISTEQSLVFTAQPTNNAATTDINSPSGVQVSIENANGQAISGDSDSVTLSLGENTSGATLSGTLTEPAINGVATFSNLSINVTGETSYTLVANDSTTFGVQTATSVPFNSGFTSYLIGSGGVAHLPASTPIASVWVATNVILSGSANSWQSRLDIENNDFDIINGTFSNVFNQIEEGYSAGLWQGEGINSSTAANDSLHLTAVGMIQNNQGGTPMFSPTNLFDDTNPGASDILLKWTSYGDTNLDRKVDGSDYSRIDNAYVYNKSHPSTPLSAWFNGDFNYDGVIDGSDYTLIDNTYNQQGASLAASIAAPAAQVATASRPTATTPALFSTTQIASQSTPGSIATGIFGSVDDLPGSRRSSILFRPAMNG